MIEMPKNHRMELGPSVFGAVGTLNIPLNQTVIDPLISSQFRCRTNFFILVVRCQPSQFWSVGAFLMPQLFRTIEYP